MSSAKRIHPRLKGSSSLFSLLRAGLPGKGDQRFAPFLIEPSKITHTVFQDKLEAYLNYRPERGVLKGDWGKLAEPFQSTNVFKGLKQRFAEKRPWEETDYYAEIANGFLASRVKRKGGVAPYLAYYDNLFEQIRTKGYKTQGKSKPIKICGLQSGQLARYDGNHRLAIALILDVELIKVRFHLIHPTYTYEPDKEASRLGTGGFSKAQFLRRWKKPVT